MSGDTDAAPVPPVMWSTWDASDWLTFYGLIIAIIAIAVTVFLYRRQKSDTASAAQRRDRLQAHRELLETLQRATDALGSFRYDVLTAQEIDGLNLKKIAEALHQAVRDARARLSDSDQATILSPIAGIAMGIQVIHIITPPSQEDIRFALVRSDADDTARDLHRINMRFVHAAHYQRRIIEETETYIADVRSVLEGQIEALGRGRSWRRVRTS